MEERHSLSEPRLCPTASDSNQAWEVDVYRENVPDPIETLRIDNETLPPRMRKGKLVWRLPTEPGKLPNFGTDERRRIMELFKEKKKSRRKKKQDKMNSDSRMLSSTSDDYVDNPKMKEKSTAPPGVFHKPSSDKEENSENESNQSGSVSVPENGRDKRKIKASKKRGSSKKENQNVVHSDKDDNETPSNGNKTKATKQIDKAQESIQEMSLNKPQQPPAPSSQDSSDSSGPPGFIPSTSSNSTTTTTTTTTPSPPPQTSQPPPNRRSIQIPCSSELSIKPTAAAAKLFINLYYPCVTHGLTAELCTYYHDRSQKSISVGGAHSVVTGLDNIAMQITSLSGCSFTVRGVVAQDASDGGAHLLITGVCTPKGGYVTAFAHSVGLARVNEEIETCCGNDHSYVIQNDALSLLNGEMATAVEHQHQQQQQHQSNQRHQQPKPQSHSQENKQQLQEQENFMNDSQKQEVIRQNLYSGNQQSSLLKPPGLFG